MRKNNKKMVAKKRLIRRCYNYIFDFNDFEVIPDEVNKIYINEIKETLYNFYSVHNIKIDKTIKIVINGVKHLSKLDNEIITEKQLNTIKQCLIKLFNNMNK